MTTEVLNVFENEENSIKSAVNYLEMGEAIAFPTETVYGLGANLYDASACAKIFEAKNRPADNPLAAHISDLSMVEEMCYNIPEEFYLLAEKFLPGPLSIILQAKDHIPSIVTASGKTLSIRNPRDDYFSKLSKAFSKPIAATSANYSGKPSPTNHIHVLQDLNGRIPAILAAGDCKYKVESTVLSLCTPTPTIYRLGAVEKEEIELVLGRECIFSGQKNSGPKNVPDAPVYAFSSLIDFNNFLKVNVDKKIFTIGDSTNNLNLYNLFEYYRKSDIDKYDLIAIFIDEDNLKNQVLINRIRLSGANFL